MTSKIKIDNKIRVWGEKPFPPWIKFFCSDNVPSLPEDVDNMTIKYIWEGRYIADYDENQDENQVDIYLCILKDKENGGNRMEYVPYSTRRRRIGLSILLMYIPGSWRRIESSILLLFLLYILLLFLYIPRYGERWVAFFTPVYSRRWRRVSWVFYSCIF